MKPDQEMDVDEKGECTRICMHAWQKEEVTRSVEHILSSLFSPAFDPPACQRASATHRNASAPFLPKALGRSTPSQSCGVQPVCCLHRADPVCGSEDAREPGNAEEALEKALCSLVA
jgi:hypothetical protein